MSVPSQLIFFSSSSVALVSPIQAVCLLLTGTKSPDESDKTRLRYNNIDSNNVRIEREEWWRWESWLQRRVLLLVPPNRDQLLLSFKYLPVVRWPTVVILRGCTRFSFAGENNSAMLFRPRTTQLYRTVVPRRMVMKWREINEELFIHRCKLMSI